jgi:hypothetical protein
MMGMVSHPARKLTSRTTLLLAADPGDALMDAARLYDPGVHSWLGRLVFRNGVLLFGPVAVTPRLQHQAGLPPGMTIAYYTGAAAQSREDWRPHEAKHLDGDKLAQGLAERLGGAVKYAEPPLELALLSSVYGEHALPVGQVIEVLRPFGGNFRIEDQAKESYNLSGEGTYFLVGYQSAQLYAENDAPPALGRLRAGPLHQWDLNAVNSRRDLASKNLASEVGTRIGEAALALASRCGGVAFDEYGFPVTSPRDLLPR